MSDFINSTINTKIYNMMSDEHQIITITDKQAVVENIGTIVSGDTNSCLLTFEINRFQDGIDLSDKKIRFNYRNSNGKFYDVAVNVKYNDDVIRFSWLLPYSLTQPGGNVIASIEFYGYIEYDEEYSYKTKNFKLSVEKSLGVNDEFDKSYSNWGIRIENDVETIQKKISEIEKEIKSIHVPTKLSEMDDDTDHRTVSDLQIDTWNEAHKNSQADWNEENTNSSAYIKNKPQIPNVTNDLTDELKSSYDEAVDKKHTHSNMSVLDGITYKNIESWNNKSEFDGQYSSLQGIPDDIATETYVDEKVAVKADATDLSDVNAVLSSRIKTIEDDYVKTADIPVNVSELANDSNYQTADDVSATLTTALEPYAKSVDVTSEISTEIAKVIADAPESFDTLKEMSDWISNHENDASAMNSTIQENKNNIVALENSKVDKIEGMGLSTNDYTTGEKTKLEGLSNYDDSAIKNTIEQNTKNIATKLDKNQGTSNSGKIAGINESGDIVPMFPQGVTYNEDTQCLEYGVDEKINLNVGIQLDDTLSKVGYAADAAKVGELKGDIEQKLDKPSSAKVGQIFRVQEVNEDGTLTLEAVDMPECDVTDVQINGESIVGDNGVANVPFATITKPGILKPYESQFAMNNSNNGVFYCVPIPNEEFMSNARRNTFGGISGRIITTETMDSAVKIAMCDEKGKAWTDTEKTGAWERLSSIKTAMDEVAVAGASYILGELTELSVVLPDDALTGQEVTVAWYNGTTPSTLSITGNMLDFDYTTEANTRSEISALWDGKYWSVIGMSQEVPVEEVVANE